MLASQDVTGVSSLTGMGFDPFLMFGIALHELQAEALIEAIAPGPVVVLRLA